MYPRNFIYEEAKIKQHTSLKKELCAIGEEAVSEFRFTCFKKKILSCYQILKIRCIYETSSAKMPKSSNILPERKNFVKPVRKQYRIPDSHGFLNYY